MAKFYSSTFGAISGKHGTAVAVTRKDGLTYLRLHVPASNPRTEKQQAHRAKFALTSKALVPFNPIFKDTIGITNGISVARSHAFKNAIVGDYPNLSVDYEKIMFSFGPLEKLHNASVTRKDNVATLNWDFKEMYNCHAGDSVSIVVFNKDTKQVLHIKDIALRLDKSTKIEIHKAWADSELYFWAYVRGGDKISDSVFVGIHAAEPEKVEGCVSPDVDEKDAHTSELALAGVGVRPNNTSRTITTEQKNILLHLLENETIDVDTVEYLLSVNHTKAYGLLNDLVLKELIVSHGKGKGEYYVLRIGDVSNFLILR